MLTIHDHDAVIYIVGVHFDYSFHVIRNKNFTGVNYKMETYGMDSCCTSAMILVL